MDEGVVLALLLLLYWLYCKEQLELTSLRILLVIGSRMSRSCHQANQPMWSRVTPFISNVISITCTRKIKERQLIYYKELHKNVGKSENPYTSPGTQPPVEHESLIKDPLQKKKLQSRLRAT